MVSNELAFVCRGHRPTQGGIEIGGHYTKATRAVPGRMASSHPVTAP
jgi:hypothetical protein